jgi:hypothetical protein
MKRFALNAMAFAILVAGARDLHAFTVIRACCVATITRVECCGAGGCSAGWWQCSAQ